MPGGEPRPTGSWWPFTRLLGVPVDLPVDPLRALVDEGAEDSLFLGGGWATPASAKRRAPQPASVAAAPSVTDTEKVRRRRFRSLRAAPPGFPPPY